MGIGLNEVLLLVGVVLVVIVVGGLSTGTWLRVRRPPPGPPTPDPRQPASSSVELADNDPAG